MVSKLWTGTEKVKLSFKNIRGLYSSLFPYKPGYKKLLFFGLFHKKTPIFGNRVTPPSVKLLYLDLKPFKLCYGCLFVISR